MSDTRCKFIESNRGALEIYRGKMSDKCQFVSGFGAVTAQESFEIILTGGNDYYLALCLLHIFWEFDNIDDRTFVLQSLKKLSVLDEEGNMSDPELAYVYAYCLHRADGADKSMELLNKLADQCFAPALATIGDSWIAHTEVDNAISYYSHAHDHGYMSVTFRLNKLALKALPWFKQIPIRMLLIFTPISRARAIAKKGIVGTHLLYLDFYGIKHHLKKYWNIPNGERIRMRSSAKI